MPVPIPEAPENYAADATDRDDAAVSLELERGAQGESAVPADEGTEQVTLGDTVQGQAASSGDPAKEARIAEIRGYFEEQYRGVRGAEIVPVAQATATIAEMNAIDAAWEAAGTPYVADEPEFIPVPENSYPWPQEEIAEALGITSGTSATGSDATNSAPETESPAKAPAVQPASFLEGAPAGGMPEPFDVAGTPQLNGPILKAAAPALTSVFTAIEPGSIQPPDPHGAVGPNHLVVTLNDKVRMQDKAGVVLSTVSLGAFWTPLGATVVAPFDPKVIYDPRSGRFYMTACSNRRTATSSMLLAVSSTSSPLDAWHMWQIDAISTDNQWADFPYIGMTEDKITLTVNMFDHVTTPGTDVFKGSRIWVSDKTTALDGGAITTFVFDKLGSSGLAAAATYDANVFRQFIINRFNANLSGFGHLQVFFVDVASGAQNVPANWTLTLSTTRPTAPPWKGPTSTAPWPDAPQLGTTQTADTNDDRITNAILRNGHIWVAHSVGMPSTAVTRISARWWEIDSTAHTTIQTGLIDGTAAGDNTGRFYWFPSVAVNIDGDAMIGMAGSKATEQLSAYYTHRTAADINDPANPNDGMDTPGLMRAGVGPFTNKRWGDYSATMVDPVDDKTFWTIQMVSTATATQWGTYWGKLAAAGPPSDPRVTGATVPNSTTVRVAFDIAMLANAELTDATNYLFTGGPAALTASSVVVVNANTVDATVNEMTNLVNYTVIVSASGPVSANGDTVNPAFNTTTFAGVSQPPTVVMTSSAATVTKTSPIPMTVAFSEAVTGFTSGDIAATNAAVSGFTGTGANYTFNLVPGAQGTVTAAIGAGVALDGVGNGNTASTTFSRTFDNVAPSVAMGSASSNPTSDTTLVVTVSFTENVTGFALADIVTSANATKGSFTTVSASTYQFSLTPTASGLITADIPGGAATDTATNGNAAAAQFSRSFDNSIPDVTLSSTVPQGPTTEATVPVTAQFSEAVTGLLSSEIAANGASVSGFTVLDADTYEFQLTPTVQGSFSVSIPGGVAQDATSNGNTASNTLTWSRDTSAPSATLSSTAPSTTNLDPIPLSIVFSEEVSGFVAGDIIATNGAIASFTTVSATNYTAVLDPAGEGVVSATLPAGAVLDSTGNGNGSTVSLSRTFDGTAPALTLGSASAPLANVSPIVFSATFGESVNGFANDDIVVTNGTASSVSGSGANYTFSVTPTGQGAVTVNTAAGRAQDAAGNGNTVAAPATVTFDSVAPTAAISTGAGSQFSVSPIAATITFSEAVTGFVSTDIGATNGTVSGFTGSGAVYTFNVTPIGEGAVIVNAAAGVAQDLAGNPNGAAQASWTYDITPPTVVMASVASNPTNLSSIPITVTFSESVGGFVGADIGFTGGSTGIISGFSGSGAAYSFNLTNIGGTNPVTLSIAAGIALDDAGNGNAAAAQFSRTIDSSAPTATLSSTAPSSTNTSPISAKVTFGEAVSGFVLGDISVSNGTPQNFVAVDALNYTFTILPTAQGAVNINVSAGTANDTAGNGNTAAAQLTRTFDNAAPTVALSSSAPSTTNVSPIPMTATFNETVTGFDLSDVAVSGGTAGSFVPVSGTVYTFAVTPAQGAVTINVNAGVAVDAASNANSAAAQLSRTFDTVLPSVVLTSTATNPTNAASFAVTATFSEDVAGFDLADIVVAGASKSNFAIVNAKTYTFTFAPSAQGATSANIAAGVCADLAGNANTAAPAFTRTFDSAAPTFALSANIPTNTNLTSFNVTVTSNEPVTGFVAADVALTNATVANFLQTNTNTYTFALSPIAQGAFGLSIPSARANDNAANGNNAVAAVTRTFDSVRPAPVAASIVGQGPTTAASIPITVAFGESVTGFLLSTTTDILVSGGTASALAGSGANYTLTLTPSGQGPVTFALRNAAANDAAGNTSEASAQLAWTFDNVAPAVTELSSTASATTNVTPVPVVAKFGENVTGFVVADIAVTNGTAGNFLSVSGSHYTFDVTPTANGPVTVNIPAGVAADGAGTVNTAAPQVLSRTFDGTVPGVTLASATGALVNTAPIAGTVTFTEPVSNFIATDIAVTNATVQNFAGSGAAYTFNLAPTGQGLVTAIVNAAVAQDAAGNQNTGSSQLSRTFDSAAPTAVIASGLTGPTNTSPIPVTVTFSEDVTGFVSGDIAAGNGTVGGFTPVSATVYTFNLTPTAQGSITATFAGGAANDAAGNGNTAPTQFSIVFDNSVPTLALSSATTTTTNSSPIAVSAQFSEAVTGFTEGDVSATNAGVQNFVPVDGDTYTFDLVPLGQGAVTANVGGGVAQDSVGNANTAAAQFSRTFDNVVPGVSISSATGATTNSSPIPVTIAFAEAVSGFVVGDLSLTNATAGGFLNVNGQVYTVNITPSGQGAVAVGVNAGVAQDAAANLNTSATVLNRTFDSVVPTVAMTSGASEPTAVTPIPVTAQFSGAVSGFASGDVVASGANVTNFIAVDGDTFTFDLVPTVQGVVTANISGAVAADAAGNSNTAASQFARTFNSANPTVVMSSVVGSPTNTSPIAVSVTFGVSVTGFNVLDIGPVVNGSVGNFAGSGTSYTFDLTPTANGVVTVDIAGGVAQDISANLNSAAPQFSRTRDTVGPGIVLSTTAGNPTNSSPIPVTATFDEAVTGFAGGDISATNGTVGNFVALSALVYTFDVTPSVLSGTVSVDVAGSAAQDTAGNNSAAAVQLSRAFDGQAPATVVAFGPASPTGTDPIPATVTFSEDVTGFVLGDIAVSGGTTGNFVEVDPANYTFEISAPSEGLVTVTVAAGAAQDASGNANAAAAPSSITFDSTDPGVFMTSAIGNPTNASTIPVTVTFSQAVANFVATDIVVTNGTRSNFVPVSASVYTFDITAPTGTVTADIAGGVAADAAGNTNTAAPQFARSFDIIAPGIALSSTATGPTNANPIPMTAQFTEIVTGFTLGDIAPGGANANNLVAVDGDTYTFDLVPTSSGPITANVAGAAASDTAGNASTAAGQFTIQFDGTVPTASISSASPDPANVSPIPVTVQFSETVTGFAIGDIAVSNAAKSNFVAVDGDTYTLDLVPSGAVVTVTANIASGMAVDTANNPNAPAAGFTRAFNNASPVPVITSAIGGATAFNSNSLAVTVTFSAPVTGFVTGDLVLGNGAASSFVAVSSTVYTFNLTPAIQGIVTVDVPANAAQDFASNASAAAVQFSKIQDKTRPNVAISSPVGDPTNVSPIPLTMTFDEPVFGFTQGLLEVTGATASGFATVTPNLVFTVNLLPSNGRVTAVISSAAIVDAAGNKVFRGEFSTTFDNVAPSSPDPILASIADDPTSISPIPVTVNFPEVVIGFAASDLDVTNATVQNFAGVGEAYTFDLVPTVSEGTVTVTLDAGAATDLALNPTDASFLSRVYDIVAPSVIVSTTAANPTNESPIPVTVTFSEAVNGFDASDIDSNAGASDFAVVSASVYTFNAVPGGQGVVTIDIPASAATDTAGNPSVALATPFTTNFDNAAPAAVMISVIGDPTATSPIPVIVSFTESVTGLNSTDIVAVNATVGGFTGTGDSYSFVLTPTVQAGAITADIAGGAAQDSAGNANPAASQFVRNFDAQDPTVTLTSTSTDPTNDSPILMTATFSEPVTGFAVDEIVAENGTIDVDSFAPISGSEFAFELIPAGDGVVTVDIAAGVAEDATANANAAAAQFTRTFDGSVPGVAMSSLAPDPTNDQPISVSVEFTEDVVEFDAGDIVPSNATVEDFAALDGATYTFDLAPSDDGLVSADIPGGAGMDAAGNGNTVAARFEHSFDDTAPNVVMSSSAANPTSALSIAVAVTFSEGVTGFDDSDVDPGNAAVENFVAVDSDTYTFDLAPIANGPVTADILGGAALDVAGNGNTAAAQFSTVFDSAGPSLVLSSASSSTTSTSPIAVTAQFSEAVTGFSQDEILASNATVANFAPLDGDTYLFDLVPNIQGTIAASVTAGAAQDAALNGNAASNAFSRIFDNASPTVALASAASNPTNASPIPVSATFSENVTGFALADIAVTNGSASNLSGAGASYTFDLAPAGQGSVAASIAAGRVLDGAGNGNIVSGQFSRVFDTELPTVSLTSTTTDPTDVTPIPVTAQFSGPVTGFSALDLFVSSATVGGFTVVNASTYTFTLTPTAEPANVSVSVPAGAAQDSAGNSNTASNALARTFSGSIPTAAMNSTTTAVTNVSPIPVTVSFTKPVTGFNSTDIVTANGTVGEFSGSGSSYAFNLAPTANGVVTATIPAGAAQDEFGAGNLALTFTRTFDNVQPSVALSTTEPDPTSAAAIPMAVNFSEAVNGFTLSDIVATNATTGGFISVDPSHYLLTLTRSGTGLVTVTASIPASAATDAAGNQSIASAPLSRTVDNEAPFVESVTLLDSPPADAAQLEFLVQFSEPVVGIDTVTPFRDFLLNVNPGGGILQSAIRGVTGTGDTRVVTVDTGVGVGQLRLDLVDDDTIADALGNRLGGLGTGNGAFSGGVAHSVDRQPPTVVVSAPSSEITRQGPISFTITYIGVASVDLTVEDIALVAEDVEDFHNGTQVEPVATATSGLKAGPVPPPFENKLAPTASVTVTQTGAFERLVTLSDIAGDGVLAIFIGNDTARDASDAPVGSVLSENVEVDNTSPTAAISLAGSARTSADSVTFEVLFSEDIGASFAGEDITLTGSLAASSTLSLVQDDPGIPEFRVIVTPGNVEANGSLGLTLLAGVNDQAQNPFDGGVSATEFTVDNTPPAVTVGPPSSSGTINGPVTFAIEYDEEAGDPTAITLAPRDVTLVRTGDAFGVIDVSTTGPLTRLVTLSDIIGNGTLGISLDDDTARDSVGNPALGTGASGAFLVDNNPLTVAIGAPSRSSTAADDVEYLVSYLGATEITLDVDDITLNHSGTATGIVSVSGTGTSNRIVTIGEISGDGTLGITIGPDTATDLVGDSPEGTGPSQVFTVDNQAPLVTVGPPSRAATASDPVTFAVSYTGASAVSLFAGDITLNSTGTAEGVLSVTGTGVASRTVTISSIVGTGSLGITIEAGTAVDTTGNEAAASAPSAVAVVDNSAPSVTVTRAVGQPALTDILPIVFDVVFDEPVTGLERGDILLGGTASGVAFALSGSGANYVVAISAVADPGTIVCTVAADAAVDAVGNLSEPSTGANNIVEFKDDIGEGCVLSLVQINLAADGMTFIAPEGVTEAVPLTVSASTDCDTGTLNVRFLLDGEEIETDTAPVYAVTFSDVLSLGLGEHVLTAIASSATAPGTTFQDQVSVVIAAAPVGTDADGNTLPDDPFDALDTEGDTWISAAPSDDTGETVASGATFWEGGAKQGETLPVTMSLSSDSAPDVQVTVSAPRELIGEGESAILVVMLAPDLVTLYGADEAGLFPGEPVEGLVADGHYVEVSILVSSDGGATFQEIPNSRLVDNPVTFQLDGLGVVDGGADRLFSHATDVENPGTGVQVFAGTGAWDRLHVRNVRISDGRIEAELIGFSTFAAYRAASAGGANISVTPGNFSFGSVAVGQNDLATFTVSNIGDGVLNGSVTVPAPFLVVSGATYSLDRFESQSVVVRFAPSAAGNVSEEISFTGGGGASVTVTGAGTAVTPGCKSAAGDAGTGWSHGDVAVLLAAVLALVAVRRRGRIGQAG